MRKKNTSLKKSFIFTLSIISCQLLLVLLSCQPSPQKLTMEHRSENQAVIHISHPQKYLLLPIEEQAEESTVWVKDMNGNNRPMQIRLAQQTVDYYVPYLLDIGQKDLTVEITHPHPVVWEQITLSDTYDASNRETFRPLYHFTPLYGWMNDPNGLVYLDGEYHLYYQYNPYGSIWENMHWGHAVTKDFIHWEHLEVAIMPDELGTVFSGNCIIDTQNTAGFGKNAMIAFYTSAGKEQTQSIAYSTDQGRTFKKYDKNPVVSADIPDFRDPNVFYHTPSEKWIMVIAAGQEVQLYSSENLLDWKYESSFGEGYGNHGGVWECPDLFEMEIEDQPGKTKWVLLLNINPGGIFGGSATQYFTGEFDGSVFTCESKPETVKWMDWGKDHYATITWSNAPDNRKIAIAWMSNWQYANQVPTKQYRSANSVPRELKLYRQQNESYLINEPVEELKQLRKSEKTHPAIVVDRSKPYHIDSILEENEGAYELEIDFRNSSAEVFGFTLFNEKGDHVDLYYNLPEKRFYMDRTKSGLVDFSKDFPAITYAPVEKADTYKLRIFVDKCSIECFAGDGKFVMTNLVFPEEPYNRLSFYSKGGDFDVESVKIYNF
ncbi:MAG: GH32 C-terminal domain-containing protein [Tannerellaceae bacterium]|nr:GH32 C-terminal domain-containing protein [Tannerellaceae bacterium]